MIEISLFGVLVGTLSAALSVVLVIVALTSVTYLAMTLITAIRAHPGPLPLPPVAEQQARRVGLSAAVIGAALSAAGLRVGSAGSGGELVPTAVVIIAFAAALGSTTACAALATTRAVFTLAAAHARRKRRLKAAASARGHRLAAASERRREGADLREEEASAEAALTRLRSSLTKLGESRAEIEGKLGAVGVVDRADPDDELASEYRRARDELTMKLELGERVLGAAEAAAFRLACGGPLRWLLRRRPKDALLGLERLDQGALAGAASPAPLEDAERALATFLGEITEAGRALDALRDKRPKGIKPGADEDPWTTARQDLDAVEDAYKAVRARIEVVRVRRAAQATLEEVTEAAGDVSETAKGVDTDRGEIQALATEITRAETAVVVATPVDPDPGAITRALGQCTAALGRSDGASLDELLKALRAIV